MLTQNGSATCKPHVERMLQLTASETATPASCLLLIGLTRTTMSGPLPSRHRMSIGQQDASRMGCSLIAATASTDLSILQSIPVQRTGTLLPRGPAWQGP